MGRGCTPNTGPFSGRDGSLIPVADPDCPHPVELLGYEQQRQQVLDNTRLLGGGPPLQQRAPLRRRRHGQIRHGEIHALSGGHGGPAAHRDPEGKPGGDAPAHPLPGRTPPEVHPVHRRPGLRPGRPDLLPPLKTILEGGLEKRPVNVAIYATSNRRHLVRQTFSERAGKEVDTFETISEKTALAERFGLRIPYMTMNKREYLALIDHLAGLYQVEMDREFLHARAMEWEIRHAGRTPGWPGSSLPALPADLLPDSKGPDRGAVRPFYASPQPHSTATEILVRYWAGSRWAISSHSPSL